MKKEILIFLLLFSSFVLADSLTVNEIDGSAEVIIVLNDDASLNDVLAIDNLVPKVKLESTNAITATINENALNELQNNPNVKSVEYDLPLKAFLDESLPLINTTKVQSTLINGLNITGKGTACIIDTGVAYNLTDFGNCSTAQVLNGTCGKIIGGIDFANEDLDPYDDYGHGTHVTSIVNAVAPTSLFVEVKLLDANGTGSISDLADSLNFCLNNRIKYNINVVSMSLGTDSMFSDVCDTESVFMNTLATIVNNLTSQNVTVIASSGNNGNSTHLPSPACLSNVTAIAASDDSDQLAMFSNRNSLVKLVAPGKLIKALWNDGTKKTVSGTSQAAPHLTGGVLLLQHYSNLKYGNDFSVPEVVRRFLGNGVTVTDSVTGLNFTRIDLFNALETTKFGVSILYPQNKTYKTKQFDLNSTAYGDVDSCWMQLNNVNGSCSSFNATEGSNELKLFVNHTDSKINSSLVVFTVDTTNPDLVLNSPLNGSLVSNGFVNLSVSTDASSCYYSIDGSVNTSFNCVETNFVPDYGSHSLDVFVYDMINNSNSTSVVFSFAPESPAPSQLNPSDNLKTNLADLTFTCKAVGENLKEIRLYDNIDGSYGLSQTKLVNGINAESNFSVTSINSGIYSWSCAALDVDNELVFTSNRTLTVDRSAPVLTILSPNQSINVTSNPVVFEYNVTDLLTVSKCELFVNNVKKRESTSILKGVVQTFSDNMADGTYTYFISCIDELGNNVNSSNRNLAISTSSSSSTPSSSSSAAPAAAGGGGGGGGGSPDESTEVAANSEGESIEASSNENAETIGTADSTSEEETDSGFGNAITGFAVSEFTEKFKGAAKVIGMGILGILGLAVIIFGSAKLLHHDWETDDIGMVMQTKFFIADKYNWIKDKFKKKTPFDNTSGFGEFDKKE